MKRFVCWYAFKGMETEGHLATEPLMIFEAEGIAEAMWKYHGALDSEWQDKFYNGDLEKYKVEGTFTGWGFCCEEYDKISPPKVLLDEIEKCKNSPYYFFTNYCLIDGKPVKTRFDEEHFNQFFSKKSE